MKEIGIKLADGSFYPIMEDGSPCNKNLVLTTVKDNQTRVIVDMYRSKTGTMEDAEYIDSLQIDNLVAHPNGSVELSLNIGLDEENKLSASMNDPETGGSSTANVTLVSRTLEERLEPTNYEVVGAKSEPEITEDDKAFELLEESFSADDVVSENEIDFEIPDEITDDEIIVENPPVTNDSASDSTEIPLETEEPVFDSADSETETAPAEEKTDNTAKVAGAAVAGVAAGGLLARALAKKAAEQTDPVVSEESTESDSAFTSDEAQVSSEPADDSLVMDDLPDFSADEPVSDETPVATETETASSSDTDFSDDAFALPSEDSAFGEEAASDEMSETFSSDSAAESQAASSDGFDFDLPDFTDDNTAADESAPVSAEQTEPAVSEESAESDSVFASDETQTSSEPELADDSLVMDDLPDFSADETVSDDATGTAETETASSSDTDFSDDSFALPTEEPATEEASSSDGFDFDLPDFSDNDETVAAETNESGEEQTDTMFSNDDLDFPDFDTDENSGSSDFGIDDDVFAQTDTEADSYVKDATPSNGIVFDGLYDKETADGNSSSTEEDSVERKTKVPVIICVICAIICVLATLLVLFVVPSKYNLLSKHSAVQDETAVETEVVDSSAEELPEEEPLPPPVEAKEEEIVVATEPETVETVVPEPPAEPETKPADIVYKIKWGDTLWDIADAYYKNPWRYHMIASYNHIKDPDYIISGTTIVLPAK